MGNREFYPGEKNVMKYILTDTYRRLIYNEDKDRYVDSWSEVELTLEEFVNLQSVLEKLRVTIY